jgi:UDP-N-acetylmuramyl pentapeptide phosphotransferase/UDP-N-acetylglucosamine-1-phosphate transferase
LGLLAISTISFIDDIVTLSNKIRLSVHFISVVLLLYFTGAFNVMPIWVWPILFILIIGTLNAYNFMDGINGMTGLYSLVGLSSLLYINEKVISFTDENFILYPVLACIVFLFFNFRKKQNVSRVM